ncbi:hypothetical protein [Shewanella marisflavi]|uniref:hypothetical protein n=1 Tax=Shewanella marisflavi TaxID=260364 RepID=UPI003AAFDF57
MSPIEQVLAAAQKLSLAGKSPSLALIKASLGNSLPMPILVQGLQRFKAMSSEDRTNIILNNATPAAPTQSPQEEATLAALQQEVSRLSANQETLMDRIAKLEARLNNEDAS